jgi:hypothetical protein
VEAQLLGLADKGWPVEATAVLAQLRVSKPDTLVSKLTTLAEHTHSGDAATGLVIAKAQAMSGDQGRQLLTDYYARHRSADIVTALGTLFLAST